MAETIRPLMPADETPYEPDASDVPDPTLDPAPGPDAMRGPEAMRGPDAGREPEPARGPAGMRGPAEPLWRDALGECLRRLRLERGEILVETARRAGVSPQYLSEMERGVKEPSSEMIAAVAGALDTTLGDLALAVATGLLAARAEVSSARIAPARTAPAGPTCLAAYALAA